MSNILYLYFNWLTKNVQLKPEQLFDLINILILLITVLVSYEIFLLQKKTTEMQLLPILVIYFKGDSLKSKKVFVKNIGKSPAFDIKIEEYNYIFLDVQIKNRIIFKLEGTNVLVPDEERELKIITSRNDKLDPEIKEFMTYLLDPIEENKSRESIELISTFRNNEGNSYYSKFITGNEGLLIRPAKKINFIAIIYLLFKKFNDKILFLKINLIWKFKKPEISTSSLKNNWFLSELINIFRKKKR